MTSDGATDTSTTLHLPKAISGAQLVILCAFAFGGFTELKNFQATAQLEHANLMAQIADNSKLIEHMKAEQSLVNKFNDITHADLKTANAN